MATARASPFSRPPPSATPAAGTPSRAPPPASPVPTPLGRRIAALFGQGFLDLLAPGLYVWAITVAWPAAQRLAPFEARLLAGAALPALVTGALLRRVWPLGARLAGLWLFVGCSVGAWTLLARAIAPSHLDPVHGVLGSVGWAAFAIVWGGDRATSEARATPNPPWPEARRRTALVMAVIATAAAFPVALAWWVENNERALLAHAVSLAAGLALLACAVDLAAPGPRDAGLRARLERPRRRLLSAAWPLVTLAGLALAGALFALLR